MLIQQRKPIKPIARARFKPFDFLRFFWGGSRSRVRRPKVGQAKRVLRKSLLYNYLYYILIIFNNFDLI